MPCRIIPPRSIPLAAAGLCLLACIGPRPLRAAEPDPLLAGFRDPPAEARPGAYWLILNGYLNREHAERELRELRAAGITGLCIFDMGARGPKDAVPPAGPPFMSDRSVEDLAHVIRIATELGMEVQLSVSSSWDMGGSWVRPEHASMGLYHTELSVRGPGRLDEPLPLPPVPAAAPRGADGEPAFKKEVAVLAIPDPRRLEAHEFIFKLDPPGVHTVDRAVLYNAESGEGDRYGPNHLFTREFSVAVSTEPPEVGRFRQVLRNSLAPHTEAQRFDFEPAEAAYVRLRVHSGHNTDHDRVQLGEFELYNQRGVNVVASHHADRSRDGAELVYYSSALGHQSRWTADNIHDGAASGPTGAWSSAGPPPLRIEKPESILDLTDRLQPDSRLDWEIPPGRWVIQRYVCLNTGETLKVPSPNSDGLATDHLSAEATRHYIQYLIDRLRSELGDPRNTALDHLYLASYEVRGPIWTPDFIERFRQYRGYDMTCYLPALSGSVAGDATRTHRFRHDYRKTLGDLLVDAYYRTASETARGAGLGIESEAGGPGPPIHNVPVDALKALGAIDAVRGEFWPRRPDAQKLWVVKETASAAHIYGKRRVHMEAFTSMHHWRDGPFDLKPAADRAFCEGMNHVVWHTAAHQPPEAGRPGWVYGAGTHLNPNVVWWPMAGAFLDYLARCSHLLQRGRFVADVCYYYGDRGFNFVPPKHHGFSPGIGYDYDVTNAEVILTRMDVRDGRLVLPDGMSYELLVLPERRGINPQVLQQIERLIAAGATVIGPKPLRANGLSGYPRSDAEVRELADRLWGPVDGRTVLEHAYGEGRVIWGLTPRQVLQRRGIGPDFNHSGRDDGVKLDYIHRRTPAADIYFVRNATERAARCEVTFRVRDRRPELWLPDTGEVRRQVVFRNAPGGIQMPLRLPPHGSVFIVFREPIDRPGLRSVHRIAEAGAGVEGGFDEGLHIVERSERDLRLLAFEGGRYRIETGDDRSIVARIDPLPEPIDLSREWRVSFPPQRGAPDALTLDSLICWTDHAHPGVRFFSGVARYEKTFDVPPDWIAPDRRIFLDLGDLWAVGRVRLNGRDLGVLWKPPYRIDASEAMRPGANELVVEVANTWANRLIGDARSAEGPDLTRTNITHTAGTAWKDAALLRSGLFGPVRLTPARSVTLRLRDADP